MIWHLFCNYYLKFSSWIIIIYFFKTLKIYKYPCFHDLSSRILTNKTELLTLKLCLRISSTRHSKQFRGLGYQRFWHKSRTISTTREETFGSLVWYRNCSSYCCYCRCCCLYFCKMMAYILLLSLYSYNFIKTLRLDLDEVHSNPQLYILMASVQV